MKHARHNRPTHQRLGRRVRQRRAIQLPIRRPPRPKPRKRIVRILNPRPHSGKHKVRRIERRMPSQLELLFRRQRLSLPVVRHKEVRHDRHHPLLLLLLDLVLRQLLARKRHIHRLVRRRNLHRNRRHHILLPRPHIPVHRNGSQTLFRNHQRKRPRRNIPKLKLSGTVAHRFGISRNPGHQPHMSPRHNRSGHILHHPRNRPHQPALRHRSLRQTTCSLRPPARATANNQQLHPTAPPALTPCCQYSTPMPHHDSEHTFHRSRQISKLSSRLDTAPVEGHWKDLLSLTHPKHRVAHSCALFAHEWGTPKSNLTVCHLDPSAA